MGTRTSTQDTISDELEVLGRTERAISQRRRELHDQIDQLYLSAPLDDAQHAELDRLEADEQAVSRERRRLHVAIDELRAEIGLPRWRDQPDQSAPGVVSAPDPTAASGR